MRRLRRVKYNYDAGKWHALSIIDGKPFYPYPQSSFAIMKNITIIMKNEMIQFNKKHKDIKVNHI